MGKFENLEGKQFGYLTVIDRGENSKGGKPRWNCICRCGRSALVNGDLLKRGITRSCGCYKSEVTSKRMTTHGQSDNRIYSVWVGMVKRCHYEPDKGYKWYGGRGITVCDEWHKFDNFYKWAIKNGYTDELTIDRIDVNGNYEPSNCRWVTFKEQTKNKTSNRLITYNGETKTLTEWAESKGMNFYTLHERISRGWDIEKALTTKVNNEHKKYTYNGESHTLTEWSKITGINLATLSGRLKWNWPIEDALTMKPEKRKRENRITKGQSFSKL